MHAESLKDDRELAISAEGPTQEGKTRMHRDKVAANVALLVGRWQRNNQTGERESENERKRRKKAPARWRKSHLLGMTSDCSDKGTTILCNPDRAHRLRIHIYSFHQNSGNHGNRSAVGINGFDSNRQPCGRFYGKVISIRTHDLNSRNSPTEN